MNLQGMESIIVHILLLSGGQNCKLSHFSLPFCRLTNLVRLTYLLGHLELGK